MDLASQRIRDKLWYGVLPNADPVSTWAGYGSGRPCDGCELIIGPKEAEHEPSSRMAGRYDFTRSARRSGSS